MDKSDLGKFLYTIKRDYGNNKQKCEINEIHYEFKVHIKYVIKVIRIIIQSGLVICDLLASIYCVYPELIVKNEKFPCTVELSGKYTRSMVVVDRSRGLLPQNRFV